MTLFREQFGAVPVRETLVRRSKEPLLVILLVVLLQSPGIVAQEVSTQPIVRDVTPSGIIRVYGAPVETEPSGETRRTFNNVRVLADGAIRSGNVNISLFGVILPARNKLCIARSGSRWACGMSAVGALRNLIHSRSIDCLVHDDGVSDQTKVVGSCRIGHTDISLRMLEQGWAMQDKTTREKRYDEAADFGRQKGLGLWADGPSSGR
jgi:endonuclease YncB( thermonuclease family)